MARYKFLNNNAIRLNIMVLVVLLFAACKDEKVLTGNDFLGKWKLTKIDVDGNAKTLTANELDSTLYFKQIGILELNGYSKILKRSGWNYQDGMLNIAIHLPASYYVEEITGTDMVLKRLDFVNGNNISTTTTHFLRTE